MSAHIIPVGTGQVTPIQHTQTPGEIVNPIPVEAEEQVESIVVSSEDSTAHQVEILNPSYDPLEKAPDEVLAMLDQFGCEVANTPENAPPVRLAGMITVHAVWKEKLKREIVAKQQAAPIELPEDVEKKFTKSYNN